MPAKSGVAGGIIAVLPGLLGIGVFSPPLDSHGNSVRGIKACEAISQRLDLHLFNRRGTRDGAVRLVFDAPRSTATASAASRRPPSSANTAAASPPSSCRGISPSP